MFVSNCVTISRRISKPLLLGLLLVVSVVVVKYSGYIPDQLSYDSILPQTADQNSIKDVKFVKSFPSNSFNVYYIWCKNDYFKFVNFLSVMSVVKYLKPNKIVLFYRDYPILDSQLYQTWMDDITQKYPFFETVQISRSVCRLPDKETNQEFIRQYLQDFPSIQWHDQVIITRSPKSRPTNHTFHDSNSRRQANKQFLTKCSVIHSVPVSETTSDLDLCVVLNLDLHPKDIWTLDNAFGRSIRKIFYDREDIMIMRPSSDELIPNIGHMMWIGGGTMDFLFYLGALSLLNVAKVDKLYIHGEAPQGRYWDLLKNESRIEIVSYAPIRTVYRQPVASVVHMSDVLRVEALKNYGGIYMDSDAIAVKPFGKQIRSYDFVINLDSMPSLYGQFPDVLSNGVMLGKKNAKFWTIFQESMKDYKDGDYTYNSCRRSYQLLERYPDLIHVDLHLQVGCFKLKCHPVWWPNYQDPTLDHTNSDIPLDWKNEVQVMHWTTPTPKELSDPKILLSSSGIFADIGQYVLEKSNLTTFFRNYG